MAMEGIPFFKHMASIAANGSTSLSVAPSSDSTTTLGHGCVFRAASCMVARDTTRTVDINGGRGTESSGKRHIKRRNRK